MKPKEQGIPRVRGERADARRNRELILRAASKVFVEAGPDVAMEEIASRAGVGVGTLYRRFPTREALYQGVAADVLGKLTESGREAVAANNDPFEALRRLMHVSLDLNVGSVLPALVSRFDFDAVVEELQADNADLVQALLERARAQGLIRPDAAFGDIVMMTVRLSRAFPGGPYPEDRPLAHRHLDIYFDGLRAFGSARPTSALEGPAMEVSLFKRRRADLVRPGGS
ncbi:AcrR family transcriptional regulator [Streptacidiphilus sp. MAP12-16]|uniref:TetR/AcrR family transcriptional regulator n=1 Tax=Streptacidiphilus sp. MAP12-16 TaxID=3156300 RepID=UPI003511423D